MAQVFPTGLAKVTDLTPGIKVSSRLRIAGFGVAPSLGQEIPISMAACWIVSLAFSRA